MGDSPSRPDLAAALPAAEGGVFVSDDPRDIGWVQQNVPCQNACPAGTNVPSYIRSIVEGRYGLSYEINREDNVLPGTLGRICSRPCEAACRHGWPGNGEPVAICHLKRAAADLKSADHRITERLYSPTGKRIAIVGAGPAGVAAGHMLSVFGHDVVLLEREERAGGMLRYGIPEFRLPRDTLDVELHNALRLGVQLRTGVSVGTATGDVRVSTLLHDYDAVLLATGCMVASKPPLQGEWANKDPAEELADVEYGLDFLMQMHRGEKKRVGQRVAVVGAGFSALDCARVVARMGAAEVTIHIRTGEDYIPVTREEIFEAKREGIRIKGLRTPIGLKTDANGRLCGIEFIQNRLGGWRSGGRRVAIPIEGSEFVEPCDTLIIAIGQQTVNDYLDVKVEVDRGGYVRIAENGMTSVNGLFAAGDFVKGASTAIEAIGHGRELAHKMDTWLMGRERRRTAVRIEPVAGPLRERSYDFILRQEMPTAQLAKRVRKADLEVETGLPAEATLEEAKRCYLCNLRYQIDVDRCIYCRACIEVAPRACIKLVKGVETTDGGALGKLEETGQWNQVAAIWIDNNECIRCGQCYKACPVRCISITRCEFTQVDL